MKSYAFAFGASVVLAASALAGDPFDWRSADGGNGHWYKVSSGTLDWNAASALANSQGGHLATFTSEAEWNFVKSSLQADVAQFGREIWAGGFQAPKSCEPGCGWQWITGEPWSFTAWHPSEPSNSNAGENHLEVFSYVEQDWADSNSAVVKRYLIEWSADCNGDGIVDFGQIRAGQLADANSDNIPDVCQCPTPHVVRVPQDAPSIAAAVALACPNNPMEIVLSPGTWTMAIDTGDPALSFTIRGLDQATCIVTSVSAGTLLNTRFGSTVRLANLTVADLAPGKTPAQDLAWELYFDGCVVRNCTGSFLFDGGPSPYPAALGTRFESCTGSGFGTLYFNGSETINLCEFVNCTRGLSVWGPSTITNCTFTATSGYAVQARASFQMSGCDFTNTAGPVISCAQTAPITAAMTVCHFTAGTDSAIVDTNYVPVDTQPGGVWDISSCGFYGNSASLDGGAIRVQINRRVTLTNSEFIGNSTGGSGGAFSQAFGGYDQSLTATNCLFLGNTALAGAGGAISELGWFGVLELNSCTFRQNSASSGGAVQSDRSRLAVQSCLFEDNESSVDGGAATISIARPGSYVRNTTFRGNSALRHGGALEMPFFVELPFQDCVFELNAAAQLGGAARIWYYPVVSFLRCQFKANSAVAGTSVFTFGNGTPIAVALTGCAISDETPSVSTNWVIQSDAPGASVGTSVICGSGNTPFSPNVTDLGSNCIIGTCIDLDGNGYPDGCQLYRVPAEYATIQAAVDAVPAGQSGLIQVAAGTYNESFALNGKNVVVRGAAGGATILDGTGLATSIARFTGGEPATAGVQDLVFRNGTLGALMYPGASYRVGGAIFGIHSQAFVRGCSFQQNRSTFGGAVYLFQCGLAVEGCSFDGNIADNEGGGMLVYESTGATRNCTFTANRCGQVNPGSGSGFKSVGARTAGGVVLLEGCTVTGGVANVDGAAVEHFENTMYVPGVLRVVNTQITGNTSNSGASGLRSLGSMQACVLASGTSVCGNANRNVDGPFLIEGAASVCDCLADVARDGAVNGGDLGVVLSAWGGANSQGSGDVNHDGLVNAEDLSRVLSAWGACP